MDFEKAKTYFHSQKIEVINRKALVLGSGLADFADALENKKSFAYQDIPGFKASSVEGHPGVLHFGQFQGQDLIVMQGRLHFYEGHSLDECTFPIRLMKTLGATEVLLTNAAGGINPVSKPGVFMIIEDHINLMGTNPLIGMNKDSFGTRFPDMSQIYDLINQDHLKKALESSQTPYFKGVYAAVSGPSYETPAEIRYMKTIGADAVGMSTVPEAIIARHAGMKVNGLSCITNFAAGLSNENLSHDDVKIVAQMVKTNFLKTLETYYLSLN